MCSCIHTCSHAQVPKSPRADEPLVWPRDYSLYLFSIRGSFRRSCIAVIVDPRFDQFIMAAITISSALLALDSPRLDPTSSLARIVWVCDHYLWPWLFLSEAILKTVALNFADGPHAYIRSPWNQLDFVIVLSSLIVLAIDLLPSLGILKNLRVLRVLRPLRLIAKSPGMRVLIETLVRVLPEASNVVCVVIALQVRPSLPLCCFVTILYPTGVVIAALGATCTARRHEGAGALGHTHIARPSVCPKLVSRADDVWIALRSSLPSLACKCSWASLPRALMHSCERSAHASMPLMGQLMGLLMNPHSI